MHMHPKDATIDRESYPQGAILVWETDSDGNNASFPPDWTDAQIMDCLKRCRQAYEEGIEAGIREGKAIIRRAMAD